MRGLLTLLFGALLFGSPELLGQNIIDNAKRGVEEGAAREAFDNLPVTTDKRVPENGLVFSTAEGDYRKTPWIPLHPWTGGYNINDLAVPAAGIVIAVGEESSIIRTTDGGQSWSTRVNILGERAPFTAVAFADPDVGVVVGDRAFRTTNRGETWTPLELRRPGGTPDSLGYYYNPYFISIDFYSATEGIVAAQNATYRTTDAGSSWFETPNGFTDTSYFRDFKAISATDWIAVSYDSTLFEYKLYNTINGGVTWTEITDFQLNSVWSVDYNGAEILISGEDADYQPSYHVSTDRGETWNSPSLQISETPTLFGYGPNDDIFMAAEGYAGETTMTELFRYDAIEEVWNPTTLTPPAIDVFRTPTNFEGVGNFGAIGIGGYIYVTTDGGDVWTDNTSGLHADITSLSLVDQYTAYVGTRLSGVLKTTDGGLTWNEVAPHVGTFEGVKDVDFLDETHGVYITSALACGTTDGGVTWDTLKQEFGDNEYRLVQYPAPDNIAIAGYNNLSYAGFFINTTDGGATWSDTSAFNEEPGDFEMYDEFRGAIAPDFGENLLLTQDGGLTWTAHPFPDEYPQSVAMPNENTVVVVTHGAETYRTTDLGDSWQTFTSAAPLYVSGFAMGDSLFGSALSDNTVGGYATTDGGATWYEDPVIAAEQYIMNVEWVDLDSAGMVGMAADGESVLISAVYPLGFGQWLWTGVQDSNWFNPNNWTSGKAPTPTDSVVVAPSSIPPVIAGQQKVVVAGLEIQPGAKLTVGGGVQDFEIGSDLVLDGTFIVTPPNAPIIRVNGVFRYPDALAKAADTSDLGFSPGFSTVMLFGDGGLERNFHSLVVGKSANLQSSGSIEVGGNLEIEAPKIEMRQEDTLVVNNDDPNAIAGGLIDGGVMGRTIKYKSTAPYRFESERTYIRFKDTVNTPDYVWLETEPDANPDSVGEDPWEALESEIDTANNQVVALTVSEFGTWGIGYDDGTAPKLGKVAANQLIRRVYRGKSGRNAPKGTAVDTTSEPSFELALRYEDSEVPAGVDESILRIYRYTGEPAGSDHYDDLPTEFSLRQNYPNPFNPSTTIEFDLAKDARAKVEIFNVLGEKVATVVDRELQRGSYSYRFVANGLATGVYIYRIQAGNYAEARKMLLVK